MITEIAALALLTTGLVAPANADPTPPEVRSITFSRETVVVSGIQTKLLNVSVHLIDDVGVREVPFFPGQEYFGPNVTINLRPMGLTLASGTPQDGVWTGGTAITSDWTTGAYRPSNSSCTTCATRSSSSTRRPCPACPRSR